MDLLGYITLAWLAFSSLMFGASFNSPESYLILVWGFNTFLSMLSSYFVISRWKNQRLATKEEEK